MYEIDRMNSFTQEDRQIDRQTDYLHYWQLATDRDPNHIAG